VTRVPVDALEMADGNLAVNAVVVGTAPDRLEWRTRAEALEVVVDGRTAFSGKATTVIIANGEFLNGADAVPRGHPGDGRIEVQVYAMDRGRRRGMRLRLGRGTHVPHPEITQASGRHVEVHVSPRSLALVCDGAVRGEVSNLDVTVRPSAFYLLV
jgi:diacylglycerol kinase family enzyme